jgi:hypothetical protein
MKKNGHDNFFYNNMMIYLNFIFIFPLALTNLSYNIYFVDMKWMAIQIFVDRLEKTCIIFCCWNCEITCIIKSDKLLQNI